MDVAVAARRYTLLAIGDGLMSQIPALLLAVSAGVAVTCVASEEEGDSLGREIARLFVAEPGAPRLAALLAAQPSRPGSPPRRSSLSPPPRGGRASPGPRRIPVGREASPPHVGDAEAARSSLLSGRSAPR